MGENEVMHMKQMLSQNILVEIQMLQRSIEVLQGTSYVDAYAERLRVCHQDLQKMNNEMAAIAESRSNVKERSIIN